MSENFQLLDRPVTNHAWNNDGSCTLGATVSSKAFTFLGLAVTSDTEDILILGQMNGQWRIVDSLKEVIFLAAGNAYNIYPCSMISGLLV